MPQTTRNSSRTGNRDIFEKAAFPWFMIKEDLTVENASDAFLKMFNVSRKHITDGISCEEVCGNQYCGTKDCPAVKAWRIKKEVHSDAFHKTESRIMNLRYSVTPIISGGTKSALISVNDMNELYEFKSRANQLENNLGVIPTPIMEIDTLYNITYINPAGAAIAGFMPDEAVGKKCYDLFKTPHCRTEKCACSRAMKTDSVITENTISRPRDGVIVPIKYTGAALKDAKGNIRGAVEYILDVSQEAKQKQMAEEKINNLNTIPTPIMAIDTDY
ncbi:MAG: PAS domain-containing protein, partial [Deltaproteobacteria bacterium]|nr:PAS domain-containing protein [Deltaproteobacteria bacterium]